MRLETRAVARVERRRVGHEELSHLVCAAATMTNSEKIQLIQLRLRALEKEAETMQLFEDTMKLMRSFSAHEREFAEIKSLIGNAQTAYEEELAARLTNSFFGIARRKAVSQLRESKQALYGSHKVANIDIENIRARIDAFESLIGFDREDGVLMFNTMTRRWASRQRLPEASVARAKDRYDYEKVRIGRHIYILSDPFRSDVTEAELRDFHLAILRYLRRIAQTEVGQNLLRELDEAATALKRKNPDTEEIVEVRLGSSAKSWACSCRRQADATAAGKPTIESVPKERGERPGNQRGTGRGSIAYVKTFPAETIQIGPGKGHVDNAWIPQHVALYHELIHALHGVTGRQDHTYLSERPSQLGDTFAHNGYWYTKEEKVTVAAEKEYSEQVGFNLKRMNYGSLGERIDKS